MKLVAVPGEVAVHDAVAPADVGERRRQAHAAGLKLVDVRGEHRKQCPRSGRVEGARLGSDIAEDGPDDGRGADLHTAHMIDGSVERGGGGLCLACRQPPRSLRCGDARPDGAAGPLRSGDEGAVDAGRSLRTHGAVGRNPVRGLEPDDRRPGGRPEPTILIPVVQPEGAERRLQADHAHPAVAHPEWRTRDPKR